MKTQNTKWLIAIIALVGITGCKRLPKEKLSQWEQKVDYVVEHDTLTIQTANPLHCSLRMYVKSPVATLQAQLEEVFPAVLSAKTDTIFRFPTTKDREELQLRFTVQMGNPADSVISKPMNLPFKNKHTYKIIQGYNGKFSHNSDYSRYALDFNLQEGDTICAAADGFVVGVIEGYKDGGNSKKWRDYANFITLFHPEMNLYTQYVHLSYQGSLVKVGDRVQSEEPIGISGKTGFTSIEHLHFNVLKAIDSGIASTPVVFEEGYKGAALGKGDLVKN